MIYNLLVLHMVDAQSLVRVRYVMAHDSWLEVEWVMIGRLWGLLFGTLSWFKKEILQNQFLCVPTLAMVVGLFWSPSEYFSQNVLFNLMCQVIDNSWIMSPKQAIITVFPQEPSIWLGVSLDYSCNPPSRLLDGQGQIWINWHKGYLDAFQSTRIAVRQEAIFEEIIFFDDFDDGLWRLGELWKYYKLRSLVN